MAQQDSNASLAVSKPKQALTGPSCNVLFSQLKELLDTAEAKSIGYDDLQLSLQNEKRSVDQLRRALETQQRQIDSFVTQDVLVSQLTSQLAAQSKTIEQIEARVQQQEKLYYSVQTQATAFQQELGHKRKRIQELELEGSSKQQKLDQLGEQLADYKDICSYVMTHTQRLQNQHRSHSVQAFKQQHVQQQAEEAEAEADSAVPNGGISQVVSSGEEDAVPDNSLAEGAAGLQLSQSKVETEPQQSSDHEEQERPHYFIPSNLNLIDRDVNAQEPRADFVSKRASCVIIGRHPQAPREVRVACRQLVGTLLLGDCCQQLKIQVAALGNKLLSPSEFEAAAGCSKGKNWKANIKVLGSNGRNQMLKFPSCGTRHGRRPKTRVLQCSAESVCEESFAEAYERVLNKALQPIRDDLEAIEDTIGMTKDDLGTVKDDLGIVKDDLGAANRWGCGLACQLDSILQQQADTVAGKLFGVGYAQSMMAQSLQELMQLLPDEAVYANLSQKEVLTTPLEYAMKVSGNLVQHKIAHRLLQRVDAMLQTMCEQPMSWHEPDGSVNLRGFLDIVNKLENQALRVALVKLKDAAIMDDDQQQQHLLMRSSPGVICAIAAALPHIYLDSPASSKVALPRETLGIDMRGRMHIMRDGTCAHTDLGQIETQPEYADPVQKLGIRLATIGWFVQLTRRLAAQSQALEQLEASTQRREKQFEAAQNQATFLQQEVGQKRKRIQDLESDGTFKIHKIQQLQHKLQEYRGICSYVSLHTQQLEQQLQEQQEGAAGLLAMTSTADRTQATQSGADAQHSAHDPGSYPEATPSQAGTAARGSASQEPRAESAPKRASCVITGRHPNTPRQVAVVCRQLTGTLVLGDCCQQLKILHNGSEMAPPDFEAAAGCSKGKNWKANIKVQGSNGRNQMLKLWLPGVMQLMGDHSKTAVVKHTDINELLDPETGLRHLQDE
ncbi:hypothetical protein WJX82_010587 [Trebouxia sp. C0006]